ncbi:MAG: gamma-glutamyltransferase [Methylobacteriaceae bacterium]|nr:gamma-glutamyltransferase [Methylobacteriaceae bacterium]
MTSPSRIALALALAGLLASGAAVAQTQAPEAATGRAVKQAGVTTRYMAAAANPLATEAGRLALRAGGSAIDAAIATQLVLNLVEPQSSGVGGGAFMVVWDAGARKLTTLDGRETAPAAAKPDRFLGPDGKPMKFMDAVVGGRSVGVPGTLKLMEEAHRRWGKLPWAMLFQPAIDLAEGGFAVSPRLNGLLARETALKTDPRARALYYDEAGQARPVGYRLRHPAFAATLRGLAMHGSALFYEGPIADDIVATVRSHATNPGDMTLADLSGYRVVEREPVCGPYRGATVCGMGPPSSGAVAVLQILGALQGKDLAAMGPGPEALHWFSEAGRLAFADRALYLGDPAFVDVPVAGLIDPAYVASRAATISPDKSMGRAKAGEPPMKKTFNFAPGEGVEYGTSHISVIDAADNAVAMTTTIEDGSGARLMTRSGFLLNNELTDFNFAPIEDGKPVANRVEPGKRPRSSMAPTIVFDKDGKLAAVVGSPGGSLIINYVAKTLVAMLDWKMDPQGAVDFSNMGSRNGPTEVEKGAEAEAWTAALQAKGHEVRAIEMTSGAQAILVTPQGFTGGADGRREGVAIGD